MAFSDLKWDQAGDRTWGDASAIYSEAKPVAIVGDLFWQFEAGQDFGSGPVEVALTRTGLTIVGQDRFGQWEIDPTIVKLANGMWPVFKAEPGVVVQLWLGAQASPDLPITWEGPYDFRIGIDKYQDFDVSGEYLAVRFTSKGQLPWELLSYTLNIEDIGEF